jgi:L-histidine Nalpha-methyltransferase
LVCDLATADDLADVFNAQTESGAARLITFFGMIPNFEPQLILPRLASLIRPEDHLLFSANLAPGADYAAGVQKVLPLYDNPLTRDWLMTLLTDFGVEHGDGELHFILEDDPAGSGLKRIAANFHFSRARQIKLDGETFPFKSGESIRLFFSYRHTPDNVRSLLARHDLVVREQWTAKSGEEGVFLCRKGNKT